MSDFILHSNLERDTHTVGRLALSRILLMNDSRFPWLILVPEIPGARELHELSTTDQSKLWQETTQCSLALARHANAYKMNVAALGNQVEQLHIHVIARQRDDAAWPGPVWGVGAAQAYEPALVTPLLQKLGTELGATSAR